LINSQPNNRLKRTAHKEGDRCEVHQGSYLGDVELGIHPDGPSGSGRRHYPAPKEGNWVVRDFRFHTGEVLPEVRLHYRTVSAPTGEPMLIPGSDQTTGHGTTTQARFRKQDLAELLQSVPRRAK